MASLVPACLEWNRCVAPTDCGYFSLDSANKWDLGAKRTRRGGRGPVALTYCPILGFITGVFLFMSEERPTCLAPHQPLLYMVQI